MSKRNIDEWKKLLIGNTYNLLTVTDVIKVDHKTMSVCICKCGNTKYVEPSRVFYGKVKSCGCLNNSENLSSRHTERHERKLEQLKSQLINTRSGSLVVQDVIINSNNSIMCICRCDCGIIKEVFPKKFKHLKSCGCRSSVSPRLDVNQLKSDLVGTKINWFTITDVYRDCKTHRVMIRIRCNCGIEKTYTKKLVFGKNLPLSCGCHHKTKEYKDAHRWTDGQREAASKARKKFYSDHPEEKLAQSNRMKNFFKREPECRRLAGERISNWFKSDKDGVKKWANKRRQFYKDHPEIGRRRSELYKSNSDIVKRISDSVKDHWKNNQNKVDRITQMNRDTAQRKRLAKDYAKLLGVIHPDYTDDLLNGRIRAYDTIETKCQQCGRYAKHKANCYVLSKADFKFNNPPLCRECHIYLTSCLVSKYEQEIADFISTFYSGELVRNDRTILNGKELDLYYPEKKIAIEFNGDYWHDENHKPRDYHYNKFRDCLNQNILLISIFESEWNSRKEEIKQYIKSTFNGISCSISFKEDLMNNNYPSYEYISDLGEYIEDSYSVNECKVFTCGYSTIISDIKSK